VAEGHRIAQLVETVARTIAELEQSDQRRRRHGDDTHQRPENLFEGFDPSVYEAEAAQRWPDQYE
jgi:hypothetical protein